MGHATNMAEVVLTCPSTQAAKRHFINDLKAEYRSIAALNKAWGTPTRSAMVESALSHPKDV